ncbi:MAG: hypothetical protein U5K30_03455 [Acidimicrobiales bacterium]|nr:hypothetical protein [Acidimicrobiales bacterium]
MSLPVHPDDIPYPPGDGRAIRRAAGELRATFAELTTARRAAEHVGAICDGAHWRGEAFEVFRVAVDRKPLPAAIDHARRAMEEAASRLEWFATRFDANTRTISWCRSRLLALGLVDGHVPADLAAEVRRIVDDAERAWDDHRAALRAVADTFDRLDDAPTFATPPRSNLQKAVGFTEAVNEFGVDVLLGAGEAAWELGKLAGQLSLFSNPVTGPVMWHRVWNARDQVGAVLSYAWDNPGAFTLELGKAIIDLDTWTEDGVARWIGHRIPDIVLTVATAGYGRVGTTAAAAVRGARATRAADAATDALGISRHFAPLRHAGALGRADAGLARLPGRLNDEIKGFTQLPDRYVRQRFTGTTVAEQVSPRLQGRLDALLTDGWTDRLGMLDGLVVGSSGLSPQAQTAMVGVLGADLTNRLSNAGLVFSELHADAIAAKARR